MWMALSVSASLLGRCRTAEKFAGKARSVRARLSVVPKMPQELLGFSP
jgi:hypothetical protein